MRLKICLKSLLTIVILSSCSGVTTSIIETSSSSSSSFSSSLSSSESSSEELSSSSDSSTSSSLNSSSSISSSQDESSSLSSSSESSSSSDGIDTSTLSTTAKNYYKNIDFSETGENLKTSLFELISVHSTLTYKQLWSCYQDTDTREDGTIWDMYSNIQWTYQTDQCGNYSKEGDCYNREHSIPQSWFNESSPMKTDIFHVYPTDGYVNGVRNNYPFGEVGIASKTSGNGSKLGSSAFDGYTGTVFEPIDEYKGDFARTYFYFATCYQNKNITCTSEAKVCFQSGSFPTLTEYSINLFLKWNEEDPVSSKEINRNEACYLLQENRNPFIDLPELSSRIWGTI